MKLGVYVINLDRSQDRWDAISSRAKACGIEIIRIAAVDGRAIASENYVDVDHRSFMRQGARTLLPGEYGCYRSHLSCLSTFLFSEFDAALVLEDDVEVGADLIARTLAILDAAPDAHLVKLYNHRSRLFLPICTSRLGDRVGHSIHGPQGSAACYVVTRSGAQKAIAAMSRICFPYDVALERGWSHGMKVLSVRRNIVGLGPLCRQTEIASRGDYRRHKRGGLRRIVTHFYRSVDYLRRIAYSAAVIRG